MKKTKLFMSVLLIILSQFAMAGPYEDLIEACKKGNLDAVKAAVEAGANINQLDAAGNAPIASSVFWPEIVTYLLEKGADPSLGNSTALYGAVVYYSVDVVKILLQNGANVNKGTEAPAYDPAAVLRSMVDAEKAKGKKANKIIIKAYEDEIAKLPPPTAATVVTPLSYAAGNSNCVECVKLLLEAGAKTDMKDAENGNLIYTVASSAAEPEVRINGFKGTHATLEGMGFVLPDWFKNLDESRVGRAEDILKLLLAKGLDVNDANTTYGYTALGRALYYKKISIAKILLENGADPKIAIDYHSGEQKLATIYPICQAAEVGDLELMKMIVEKGADINTRAKGMSLMNIQNLTGGENYTPLNLALANRKGDVALYLIEQGADINIGVEGTTFVRPRGLPAGADLYCQVIVTNKTPIYWAAEAGLMDVVVKLAEKMLWKFNPDFTVRSMGGQVTWAFAVYECKFDKTKYIPSDWAGMNDQKEIEIFLMGKGM
ncbi:MAG: ankyrin repeat domain-containing protein [Bacteroidales bacterium]|nr:ankyrin repeat domain-containing protein [Bacteroidales bacterium]